MVARVIDGDTIEANFRGSIIDVRLIGVDTPETVYPSEPVEYYGPAASRFTTRASRVSAYGLSSTSSGEDRFGRTLAYVWLNGRLFDERLVREGFANVSTFPPNVRYVERFLAAQREARSHDRGLWGSCIQIVPPGEGGGDGEVATGVATRLPIRVCVSLPLRQISTAPRSASPTSRLFSLIRMGSMGTRTESAARPEPVSPITYETDHPGDAFPGDPQIRWTNPVHNSFTSVT